MPHYYGGLIKIEVYLPQELYDRLERLRAKTGLKLSAFVRSILKTAFDAIEGSEDNGTKQE